MYLNDSHEFIPSVLERHAVRYDDVPMLHFLDDWGGVCSSLSYSRMHHEARRLALEYEKRNLRQKAVVIIGETTGDFVVAFLACLYSGAIAVPAAPPRRINSESFRRLQCILDSVSAELVIVGEQHKTLVSEVRNYTKANEFDIRTVKQLLNDSTGGFANRTCLKDAAFIQFSSGTTGDPKGVMISHGALLSNLEIIQKTFRLSSDSKLVGWLPMFHDMGLVGNLLSMLYVGGVSYMMSPNIFMQKPLLWLQSITQYKANTSGGPNFAYDLCVEKITDNEQEQLDLESWKTAFNGAEVVRPSTIQSFSDKFFKNGFDKKSFLPCYGMAEATLLVSGSHLDSIDISSAVQQCPNTQFKIHSSGPVCDGWIVKVVDPDHDIPLKDGDIGEIWISGESLFSDYWGSSDKSHLRELASEKGKLFYRTGDYGKIENKQLFITGRKKEMIIIRGRNIFPHDIEGAVCELHSAFVKNGAAAVSVGNQCENLFIVQELERFEIKRLDFRDLENRIYSFVSSYFSIAPAFIGLVVKGKLPRTTSGKIKRIQLAKLLEDGSFSVLNKYSRRDLKLKTELGNAIVVPRDRKSLAKYIIDKMHQELKLPGGTLSVDTPLFQVGIDSSAAAGLTASFGKELGVSLEPTLLLEVETIEDLVIRLMGDMDIKIGV
ncbi:AMP-binding protein [Teredinibacter turnerae]|uniref:AMP-binding protein n=1 Tax=Teredinibacter turnerae TaxID=2426 RepID=UPI0003A5E311|nr:AMP-binding protein [Teredinibacter turnerae]